MGGFFDGFTSILRLFDPRPRRPERVFEMTAPEQELIEAKAKIVVLEEQLRQAYQSQETIDRRYVDVRCELQMMTVDQDELQRVFDIQRTRMGEATALWRKENPGNDFVLPDLGDLLDWLMKRGASNA